MHRPFPTLAVALLLAILPLLATPSARADDEKDADLKRKQEEVERLTRELDKAQSDLKKLQTENQRLRKEKQPPASAPAPLPPAAPGPPPPPKPIDTLPPLAPGTEVDLADLVGHYRSSPDAAVLRYNKQSIRLKGQVAQLDAKMFRRSYAVLLTSPDPAFRIVCNFSYAGDDSIASVYTAQRGSQLMRSDARGGAWPILAVGETVTIQGRCHGLRGNEIVLNSCTLAP